MLNATEDTVRLFSTTETTLPRHTETHTKCQTGACESRLRAANPVRYVDDWNGFFIPVPACSSVDHVMIDIERNLFVNTEIWNNFNDLKPWPLPWPWLRIFNILHQVFPTEFRDWLSSPNVSRGFKPYHYVHDLALDPLSLREVCPWSALRGISLNWPLVT